MDITRRPPRSRFPGRPSGPSGPSGGIRRLLRGALELTLPAACLGCGGPGEGGGPLGLCLGCRGRLRRPAPGCGVCGEPIPAAALQGGSASRSTEPGGWLCGGCRRDPPPFEALVVPWSYAGPIVEVVRALKFGRLDYLGEHLARELARELARRLAPGDEAGAPDAVVPVPLHWRRRWARGYNQAERIARPLARLLGAPCVGALRRRRATPPQVGLDRERRLANPRRAFAPRRLRRRPDADPGLDRDRRERRAVLVDDVVTTGATLRSAAEALRRAGFSRVVAVAVARTPEGGGGGSAER